MPYTYSPSERLLTRQDFEAALGALSGSTLSIRRTPCVALQEKGQKWYWILYFYYSMVTKRWPKIKTRRLLDTALQEKRQKVYENVTMDGHSTMRETE